MALLIICQKSITKSCRYSHLICSVVIAKYNAMQAMCIPITTTTTNTTTTVN